MRDYSMMYGCLYDEDIDSLQKLKKQYKEKLKEIQPTFKKYKSNQSILTTNINIFEKVIVEKKQKEIKNKFKLKKEHLQLLQYINFGDSEILAIDQKRPLGSSSFDYGLKDILNISDLEFETNEEKYLLLLDELKYAIEYLITERLKDMELEQEKK